MIDLHTHSIFSDGELVPSELVRRAKVCGYRAIAITDHMDMSNLDFIIPRIVEAAKTLSTETGIDVIPGAEITHVPPPLIKDLVQKARDLGAMIVVVHGETLAEPVEAGTNRAGIEARADILAHPGLITMDDAILAAEKGVMLEITSRKGHSLSNGHVAKTAMMAGADILINTDAHSPDDLITREVALSVLRGAGIPEEALDTIIENGKKLIDRLRRR